MIWLYEAILAMQALLFVASGFIAWKQLQNARSMRSINAWMEVHREQHRVLLDYEREHVLMHGMMGRGRTWPGMR